MLASSFDEVERRIADRGGHTASFAELDAGQIADAFRSATYADAQDETYLGIATPDFCRHFDQQANDLMWAPDGDEAFDDGSYVLQFDLRGRVRLIAFTSGSGEDWRYDPATLAEIWVPADIFYQILQQWRDSFEAEWARLPKVRQAEE
jgi:hypothetical protein